MPTREKNREYQRRFRSKNRCIYFNIGQNGRLYDIYKAIPNKNEWFIKQLKNYAAKHPELIPNDLFD